MVLEATGNTPRLQDMKILRVNELIEGHFTKDSLFEGHLLQGFIDDPSQILEDRIWNLGIGIRDDVMDLDWFLLNLKGRCHVPNWPT